jgi:hypothetical protein
MKIPKIPYLWVIAIPVLSIFLGTASNQAVLIANWGKFPVMVNDREKAKLQARSQNDDDDQAIHFSLRDTSVTMKPGQIDDQGQFIDDTHTVMGHNSRLKFLADYINLRIAIFSPGDGFILLGQWLMQFAPIAWLTLIIRKLCGNTT